MAVWVRVGARAGWSQSCSDDWVHTPLEVEVSIGLVEVRSSYADAWGDVGDVGDAPC